MISAEIRRVFLDHNIDLWISPSTVGPAPKGLESTGDPVMNLPWGTGRSASHEFAGRKKPGWFADGLAGGR